jgi:hypothetical protein
MSKFKFVFLSLALCSCTTGGNSEGLTGEDRQTICKAAISMEMGQNISIMESYKAIPEISRIEYVRPSDGKRWKYECKFPGDNYQVVWRGVDIFAAGGGPGRWRDSAYDDEYFYSISGDGAFTLKRKFVDRSITTEQFSF